ncbi:MAG: hypothetical protein U0232_17895 [Thermomicrobiales bacterium]
MMRGVGRMTRRELLGLLVGGVVGVVGMPVLAGCGTGTAGAGGAAGGSRRSRWRSGWRWWRRRMVR